MLSAEAGRGQRQVVEPEGRRRSLDGEPNPGVDHLLVHVGRQPEHGLEVWAGIPSETYGKVSYGYVS